MEKQKPAIRYFVSLPSAFAIIELRMFANSRASWLNWLRSAIISSVQSKRSRKNLLSLASRRDVRNFISRSRLPRLSVASL